MADIRTADQVRGDRIRAMGEELGATFDALANEVTWLHAKWAEYRQLFAHSTERVALLNQTAGFFFRVVQDTMLDDVLLHLARLTDRAETRPGKTNLSLNQLPGLVADPGVNADVQRLVDGAVAACKPAQDWRNRRIAHCDLSLALKVSDNPLPGISLADIDSALRAIRAPMQLLEKHYLHIHNTYEWQWGGPGGAHALAIYLAAGVEALNARKQRLLDGKPLPEDLRRSPHDPSERTVDQA